MKSDNEDDRGDELTGEELARMIREKVRELVESNGGELNAVEVHKLPKGMAGNLEGLLNGAGSMLAGMMAGMVMRQSLEVLQRIAHWIEDTDAEYDKKLAVALEAVEAAHKRMCADAGREDVPYLVAASGLLVAQDDNDADLREEVGVDSDTMLFARMFLLLAGWHLDSQQQEAAEHQAEHKSTSPKPFTPKCDQDAKPKRTGMHSLWSDVTPFAE